MAAPAGAPFEAPSFVGVGRPPAGDPALVDDATTALAIPVGATASLPRDQPAGRQSGPVAPLRGQSRATPWLGRAIVIAALLLVGVVALTTLLGSSSPAGPAGSPASPSLSGSAPVASPSAASPSITPSAPLAPSPSPDPAIAALNAMDAAIAAARGGSDGLKGKDANELEKQTADIRRALDSGDRAAALDMARKLDRRVADLAKNLGTDQATRLRTASEDLVRALGG